MQKPFQEHWKAVKKILRYLAAFQNHGLKIVPTINRSITAFCDADWATDRDDRKSITGYCVYFGSNLISWSSKKQTTVSISSTEAEYRSMASTVAEVLWIKSLLSELKVQLPQVPRLFCDNQSAVLMTANPILHARTKHLELDLHFVRERAIRQEIQISHIPSSKQVADGFTKPISSRNFDWFRKRLGVKYVP